MALIVEDGSIAANAESYTSEEDATTYFAAHGSPTRWTAASSPTREAALRYAVRWLDARYGWSGTIVSTAQLLAWPRWLWVDADGRSVSSVAVPQKIKEAQCEAALAHLTKTLAEVRSRGGAIDSVALPGGLAVSFSPGASTGRTFPYIDDLVAGYVVSNDSAVSLIRS